MRSVIRTGALRGIPANTATPQAHSGIKNIPRTCATAQSPDSSFNSSPTSDSKAADYSLESVATPAKHAEAEPSSVAPLVTPRGRVTIADIKERRAKTGRLVAPTAAYSDADMFKGPVSTLTLDLNLPLNSFPMDDNNNAMHDGKVTRANLSVMIFSTDYREA